MEFNLTVRAAVCPLYSAPDPESERVDEVLSGWSLWGAPEKRGWYAVTTDYGYEGYAPAEHVRRDVDWVSREKWTVARSHCDVLSGPELRCPLLTGLVRGSLAVPLGAAGDWQKIALPDGREGYTRAENLGKTPRFDREEDLRAALTETALSYLGTQYRWGGKSPLGVDCSGLVFMAYRLCGVTIWRDSTIKPGFPVHAVDFSEKKPGDLLYFPGHVAMYLGDGEYVHATARTGDDGVTVSSLERSSPRYRADLAEKLLAVGSVFP